MKFIVSVKPKSIIRIKENLEFKENFKKIRKILRYLSLISSIMLRKLRFRQKWFSCKKNLYADYVFDVSFENFCRSNFVKRLFSIAMVCAIYYHLYNLKNVKNTHGGALLLVKLQAFCDSKNIRELATANSKTL